MGLGRSVFNPQLCKRFINWFCRRQLIFSKAASSMLHQHNNIPQDAPSYCSITATFRQVRATPTLSLEMTPSLPSPCAGTPASHHYSPACMYRQNPQQLSEGSESGPWRLPPARTTHHQCWRTCTQPHWKQQDTPGHQCHHHSLDSLTAQPAPAQQRFESPTLQHWYFLLRSHFFSL